MPEQKNKIRWSVKGIPAICFAVSIIFVLAFLLTVWRYQNEWWETLALLVAFIALLIGAVIGAALKLPIYGEMVNAWIEQRVEKDPLPYESYKANERRAEELIMIGRVLITAVLPGSLLSTTINVTPAEYLENLFTEGLLEMVYAMLFITLVPGQYFQNKGLFMLDRIENEKPDD